MQEMRKRPPLPPMREGDALESYLIEGSCSSPHDPSGVGQSFSYVVLLLVKGDRSTQAHASIVAKLGHGNFKIKRIFPTSLAPGTRPHWPPDPITIRVRGLLTF